MEKKEFLAEIARVAKKSHSDTNTPWLDAVQDVAFRHDIDDGLVAEWITRKQDIMEVLLLEGGNVNLVKRDSG